MSGSSVTGGFAHEQLKSLSSKEEDGKRYSWIRPAALAVSPSQPTGARGVGASLDAVLCSAVAKTSVMATLS